jgi:hypothetical protein
VHTELCPKVYHVCTYIHTYLLFIRANIVHLQVCRYISTSQVGLMLHSAVSNTSMELGANGLATGHCWYNCLFSFYGIRLASLITCIWELRFPCNDQLSRIYSENFRTLIFRMQQRSSKFDATRFLHAMFCTMRRIKHVMYVHCIKLARMLLQMKSKVTRKPKRMLENVRSVRHMEHESIGKQCTPAKPSESDRTMKEHFRI